MKYLDLLAIVAACFAIQFLSQASLRAAPVPIPIPECGPVCKSVYNSEDCANGFCLHTDQPSCYGCRGTNPYNCVLTASQGNACIDTQELIDVYICQCDHCPCTGFTAAEAWDPVNLGDPLSVKHSRHACFII